MYVLKRAEPVFPEKLQLYYAYRIIFSTNYNYFFPTLSSDRVLGKLLPKIRVVHLWLLKNKQMNFDLREDLHVYGTLTH